MAISTGGQTENLIVKLIGKDQFSKTFATAETKIGGLHKKLGQFAKAAALAGAAFAVGIGIKSISAAAQFEKEMSNVATLVDTSKESMVDMGNKVRDIAKKVPVEISDLTKALYNVRSAGISAADATDVLETSGKLAVAGLATTEEAVDLLTSAINVYGDESHDSDKLADILFKTVKAGKTTVAELAQGFGKVAAIAKETGISIEDLSAATAVLTTGGIKAAEAQVALKAMIANILKPTADATGAAKRLGIKFNLTALQADGLSGMLVKIAEKAGSDKQALADLFGSVEAANAVFGLTSEDGGAMMRDILVEMTDGSSALNEAFKKQNETTAAQYQLLKNNLNVVMQQLGTKILPVLTEAVKQIVEIIDTAQWLWGIWNGKIVESNDALYELERKLFIAMETAKEFIRTLAKVPATAFKYSPIGLAKDLLGFQEGGVVPGPIGAPMPAIVHGGETVIPANKNAGISITITGNTFIGEDDFAEKIGDILFKQLQLNAKI